MELFETSDIILQAIGRTVVHSLWIGFLILAVLRLALAFIHEKYAEVRYDISVSALLLFFFSVAAVFAVVYDPGSAKQPFTGLEEAAIRGIENGSGPVSRLTGINSGHLFFIFGYIYLAGVLFMVFRTLSSAGYYRNIQNSGSEVSARWKERFEAICTGLGITTCVNLLESDLVQSPLLLAYLKPAVIVPAGMLTHLPAAQVEAILLHELYHLKRRDYLINVIQLVMEGVLFYHPAVWQISAAIRKEREHCCDDRVLSSAVNPLNYAKALIEIAEKQHFSRMAPGAVGSEKQQFRSRIKRILNQNSMKTKLRDKVVAASVLALSLILLLTVSGFNTAPAEKVDYRMVPERNMEMIGDTIPEESPPEAVEEIEEIDWESIRQEVEEAHAEALKEIEEIDWESIRQEVEEAHAEALKEMEEIDWESIRQEMELGLSEMRVDMEELKMNVERSMEEVNWEEIREQIRDDLEEARIVLDSIRVELDRQRFGN